MAEQPEQLHRDWQSAYNRGDLDSMVSLYEQEAVMIAGPSGATVRGRDEICQLLKGFLSLDGMIEIHTLDVISAGDLALLTSEWNIEAEREEVSSIELSGTGNEVVRRQGDGTWRYVIDHPWGATSSRAPGPEGE